MTHIRLSPTASVVPTDAGFVLRSDFATVQLDGADARAFAERVVPLLDGTRTLEQVVAAVPELASGGVRQLLEALVQRGLVESLPAGDGAPDRRWVGQQRFLASWGADAGMHALRGARVLLVGLEPWGAALAAELAAAGVGELCLLDERPIVPGDLPGSRLFGSDAVETPRNAAVAAALALLAPDTTVRAGPLALDGSGTLVVPDGPWDLVLGALAADELSLLQGLARYGQAAGVRSLTGHLEGVDAVVGPLVVPGETACWSCTRLRRLGSSKHIVAESALQHALLREGAARRVGAFPTPTAGLLAQLLALEAVKLLTRYALSNLGGRLLIQSAVTLDTTWHTIVRLPWCAVCGGAASAPRGGDPAGDEEGIAASTGVEQLREQLAGWVDERVGVIRQLEHHVPADDDPQLPFTATAVLASYAGGMAPPQADPQLGSGKGRTRLEALVGAAGEAIERYSAARYRPEDLRRTQLAELEGDVLDPRELGLYAAAQYAQAEFPFAPIAPDRPLDWVRGRWLADDAPVWLPALPCYFNFHAPPAELFCQVSSNGLAAGATFAAAAQRAVLELVERDAFVLTWMAGLPTRRLVLDETLDPLLGELVRELERMADAIELYLLDAGLGIPVVACLGLGDGERWPGMTVALAADLDAGAAARKALLEQGHVGPYLRRLMRETPDAVPAGAQDVKSLIDHALYYVPRERVAAADALRAAEGGSVSLGDVAGREDSPSGGAALDALRDRLHGADVRIALADVTSPDVAQGPFRVVRALGARIQQLHFGHALQQLGNPRLHGLARAGLTPHPHPLA